MNTPVAHDYSADYSALGIRLSSQEEYYVMLRVRGVNPSAAARSAGFKAPAKAVAELAENQGITQAIAYFREMARSQAVAAGAIEFTKDDATALYMEAHAKSATATEEIKAVDSLVKLHGLLAPDKVEVTITRRDQLESLSDEKLLEMSGHDLALDPSQYEVIEEEEI